MTLTLLLATTLAQEVTTTKYVYDHTRGIEGTTFTESDLAEPCREVAKKHFHDFNMEFGWVETKKDDNTIERRFYGSRRAPDTRLEHFDDVGMFCEVREDGSTEFRYFEPAPRNVSLDAYDGRLSLITHIEVTDSDGSLISRSVQERTFGGIDETGTPKAYATEMARDLMRGKYGAGSTRPDGTWITAEAIFEDGEWKLIADYTSTPDNALLSSVTERRSTLDPNKIDFTVVRFTSDGPSKVVDGWYTVDDSGNITSYEKSTLDPSDATRMMMSTTHPIVERGEMTYTLVRLKNGVSKSVYEEKDIQVVRTDTDTCLKRENFTFEYGPPSDAANYRGTTHFRFKVKEGCELEVDKGTSRGRPIGRTNGVMYGRIVLERDLFDTRKDLGLEIGALSSSLTQWGYLE